MRRNVLALSGRAVEASGDVDVLLLDKTGTITLGNRQAAAFIPMPGVEEADLAEAAQMASLADETPEGRSIVVLAKQYGIREHELGAAGMAVAQFVPFTAQTRMSGVDYDGTMLRKGAGDAILRWISDEGGKAPAELQIEVDRIARQGATPLAVARNSQVLGVDRAARHRQGGHAPPLRPAARDGHPDRHGDRRQPADGGRDRRGGGRRRLPRRGDARSASSS